MTFQEYQEELIKVAKELQGEHYIGDAYYQQDCWLENYDDKQPAEWAVKDDICYGSD